jgi:hypothetical protein
MSESVSTLIDSGFAFGFLLLFVFWGLTIPIRWLIRHVGL